MNCFCTIITSNYFFYTKAIYDSLDLYSENLSFKVLIVDDFNKNLHYKSIELISLEDIKSNFAADYNLIKHYENDRESNLRWALKPLFLKYLIDFRSLEKVIFIDPDTYFFKNPSFLFKKLDKADILITPHWRSKDPFLDESNFNELFSGGLFNAGFFGCTSKSVNVLDWWFRVCAYKMIKTDGFYVDQAYLNLIPIYFSGQVKILQHKGCNVANWNMVECKRTNNGKEVLICNEFPIVFIHFTNNTINNILSGKDNLLKPYLDLYQSSLLKHNKNLEFNFKTKNFGKKYKYILKSFFNKMNKI